MIQIPVIINTSHPPPSGLRQFNDDFGMAASTKNVQATAHELGEPLNFGMVASP